VPLKPSDVANKLFDKAFRGYAMDEVDAFLDEVEGELTRLLTDKAALQRELGSDARPVTAAPADAVTPPAATAPETTSPETTSPEITSPEAEVPETSAPAAGESQDAALRTLVMAQRTADQAIAEAREEAEATLSLARSQAESELADARTEAEELLEQARQRATELDEQVDERTSAALGALTGRERELETRIEQMRAFEREYRQRLRAYLESRLRDLDGGSTASAVAAADPASAAPLDGALEPSAAPQPLGPFTSTHPVDQAESPEP